MTSLANRHESAESYSFVFNGNFANTEITQHATAHQNPSHPTITAQNHKEIHNRRTENLSQPDDNTTLMSTSSLLDFDERSAADPRNHQNIGHAASCASLDQLTFDIIGPHGADHRTGVDDLLDVSFIKSTTSLVLPKPSFLPHYSPITSFHHLNLAHNKKGNDDYERTSYSGLNKSIQVATPVKQQPPSTMTALTTTANGFPSDSPLKYPTAATSVSSTNFTPYKQLLAAVTNIAAPHHYDHPKLSLHNRKNSDILANPNLALFDTPTKPNHSHSINSYTTTESVSYISTDDCSVQPTTMVTATQLVDSTSGESGGMEYISFDNTHSHQRAVSRQNSNIGQFAPDLNINVDFTPPPLIQFSDIGVVLDQEVPHEGHAGGVFREGTQQQSHQPQHGPTLPINPGSTLNISCTQSISSQMSGRYAHNINNISAQDGSRNLQQKTKNINVAQPNTMQSSHSIQPPQLQPHEAQKHLSIQHKKNPAAIITPIHHLPNINRSATLPTAATRQINPPNISVTRPDVQVPPPKGAPSLESELCNFEMYKKYQESKLTREAHLLFAQTLHKVVKSSKDRQHQSCYTHAIVMGQKMMEVNNLDKQENVRVPPISNNININSNSNHFCVPQLEANALKFAAVFERTMHFLLHSRYAYCYQTYKQQQHVKDGIDIINVACDTTNLNPNDSLPINTSQQPTYCSRCTCITQNNIPMVIRDDYDFNNSLLTLNNTIGVKSIRMQASHQSKEVTSDKELLDARLAFQTLQQSYDRLDAQYNVLLNEKEQLLQHVDKLQTELTYLYQYQEFIDVLDGEGEYDCFSDENSQTDNNYGKNCELKIENHQINDHDFQDELHQNIATHANDDAIEVTIFHSEPLSPHQLDSCVNLNKRIEENSPDLIKTPKLNKNNNNYQQLSPNGLLLDTLCDVDGFSTSFTVGSSPNKNRVFTPGPFSPPSSPNNHQRQKDHNLASSSPSPTFQPTYKIPTSQKRNHQQQSPQLHTPLAYMSPKQPRVQQSPQPGKPQPKLPSSPNSRKYSSQKKSSNSTTISRTRPAPVPTQLPPPQPSSLLSVKKRQELAYERFIQKQMDARQQSKMIASQLHIDQQLLEAKQKLNNQSYKVTHMAPLPRGTVKPQQQQLHTQSSPSSLPQASQKNQSSQCPQTQQPPYQSPFKPQNTINSPQPPLHPSLPSQQQVHHEHLPLPLQTPNVDYSRKYNLHRSKALQSPGLDHIPLVHPQRGRISPILLTCDYQPSPDHPNRNYNPPTPPTTTRASFITNNNTQYCLSSNDLNFLLSETTCQLADATSSTKNINSDHLLLNNPSNHGSDQDNRCSNNTATVDGNTDVLSSIDQFNRSIFGNSTIYELNLSGLSLSSAETIVVPQNSHQQVNKLAHESHRAIHISYPQNVDPASTVNTQTDSITNTTKITCNNNNNNSSALPSSHSNFTCATTNQQTSAPQPLFQFQTPVKSLLSLQPLPKLATPLSQSTLTPSLIASTTPVSAFTPFKPVLFTPLPKLKPLNPLFPSSTAVPKPQQ